MQKRTFVYLRSHRIHRVKRHHRLLKDHGSVFTAYLTNLLAPILELEQVLNPSFPRKKNPSAGSAFLVVNAQNGFAGEDPAATRLTHQSQNFTFLNRKGQPTHRRQHSLVHWDFYLREAAPRRG